MPTPQQARPAMTALYFLLLIDVAVESLYFSPPSLALLPTLVLALLKLLPILAFSPWLWRRDSASPMGLCLVLLVYLCLAAVGSFQTGLAGHVAQLRCLLVTGLIAACLLVVRRPKNAS